MIKRSIDWNASDIYHMSKEEKLMNIWASEGRTLISEIVSTAPPLLSDVSNVELACGFGADLILLNFYDVNHPMVQGILIEQNGQLIHTIKEMTGRMIGINLEPVDERAEMVDQQLDLPQGRKATVENVKKALEQGIDFIVLTGNPKTGVTNEAIQRKIKEISREVGTEIILAAGKMHGAGTTGNVMTIEIARQFILAGADIILLPAPGTIPGMTVDCVKELVEFSHQQGKMAMTAIGTSQEGADEDTIKRIALYCKMAGADLHHIGDAGISPGIATPENIMAYSIAIKGKRHTYRRMAKSVNR